MITFVLFVLIVFLAASIYGDEKVIEELEDRVRHLERQGLANRILELEKKVNSND